jgi:hypothetical protein
MSNLAGNCQSRLRILSAVLLRLRAGRYPSNSQLYRKSLRGVNGALENCLMKKLWQKRPSSSTDEPQIRSVLNQIQ